MCLQPVKELARPALGKWPDMPGDMRINLPDDVLISGGNADRLRESNFKFQMEAIWNLKFGVRVTTRLPE